MTLNNTANKFLNDCILALQTVKGDFSMDCYTLHPFQDDDGNLHGCGTPACVLGHYATMALAVKSVRKRKFILADEDDDTVMDLAGDVHVGTRPDITGNLEEQHLDELFSDCEIEVDGTSYPNGCGGAKTAKEAIAYIRQFILKHGGTLREQEPAPIVEKSSKVLELVEA